MSRPRGFLSLLQPSPLLSPFRSTHLHPVLEPCSQADAMPPGRHQCVAKFFASSELISKSASSTVLSVCVGPQSMLMCRQCSGFALAAPPMHNLKKPCKNTKRRRRGSSRPSNSWAAKASRAFSDYEGLEPELLGQTPRCLYQ